MFYIFILFSFRGFNSFYSERKFEFAYIIMNIYRTIHQRLAHDCIVSISGQMLRQNFLNYVNWFEKNKQQYQSSNLRQCISGRVFRKINEALENGDQNRRSGKQRTKTKTQNLKTVSKSKEITCFSSYWIVSSSIFERIAEGSSFSRSQIFSLWFSFSRSSFSEHPFLAF